MQYLGIDWSYRRAAWCAVTEGGGVVAEGAVSADEDGLARLVLKVGVDVRAVAEMMSGAILGARHAGCRGLGSPDRACAQRPRCRAAGVQDRQGCCAGACRAVPPRPDP